jgi:hypothetical protein
MDCFAGRIPRQAEMPTVRIAASTFREDNFDLKELSGLPAIDRSE